MQGFTVDNTIVPVASIDHIFVTGPQYSNNERFQVVLRSGKNVVLRASVKEEEQIMSEIREYYAGP